MKDYKALSLIILGTGSLGAYLIIASIPDDKISIVDYVSVIGTFASIAGLIVAYLQILSIKDTSISIQNAVKVSTNRINTVLSVSEVAKSKKITEEIQMLIQHDNIEGALIRMKDLKELLIQNKYNSNLENTSGNEYNSIIINTGIDIKTLNDYVLEIKTKINRGLIVQNLEKTRAKLIEFENELKNIRHDTK